MSIARKYLFAAAFVAFVSWVTLTDWIPSIRWIPHAFLAGVVATFGGLVYLLATTSRGLHSEQDVYKPYAPVAPAFARADSWEDEKAQLRSRAEYRRPLIFPEAVTFSKEVDETLDWVIRDFVTSWYQNISKRLLFQHEIDRCIRSVLLALAARLTNIDLVQIGVSKLLPLVTDHLKEFYFAERAVRGKDLSFSVTDSEELNTAIASKYPRDKLHATASFENLDGSEARQSHVRGWIRQLLPVLLPGNMQSSPAVMAMVREIVTCAVFGPVVQMLIDANTWNEMIVLIGGPMLRDRKAVRKMRAALDQNAPTSPRAPKSSQFPRLKPYDGERQYERFVRAIRQTNNLSDARRFRSEVGRQLRRDSTVEDQEVVYIRRLETGRRLLDQKIASLSADGDAGMRFSTTNSRANANSASRKRQASLREVLYDASGLSYFMEFMDRLHGIKLVQFYLVVDGFRGPLEGDYDDTDPTDPTDQMDIVQMYESYLSRPELQASEEAISSVKNYLEPGGDPSPQTYAVARKAILRTQTEVYNTMTEKHYPKFKESDLYYKWLAIDEKPLPAAAHGRMPSSLSSNGSRSRDSSPVTRKLQAASRVPELRRAVLSSSNLFDKTNSAQDHNKARRSMDDNGVPPLFADDINNERMTQSLGNLRADDSESEGLDQTRTDARAVSAMQLALDKIVGTEDKDYLGSEPIDVPSSNIDGPLFMAHEGSARSSLDHGSSVDLTQQNEHGKPSISSLGLVGQPQSRGVFYDDLFGAEAEKYASDEKNDSDEQSFKDDDMVQEAAPGDLGLTEAISALSMDIERLSAQKNIVDSLTSKAELTNNAAELRILRKSEQSLLREIKRKEMQKQQYVIQEEDNDLYGRAAIVIKSVMIGRDDDGHEYALYVIQVRKQATEQRPAASWAVTRRYSQFHELHKRLRARFPSVRELEFPRRQALFTLQKDFVEKRRVTLERYLRSLLLVPTICRSREFRAFLSQSSIVSSGKEDTQADTKDFVSRIYNSVSDGMEDFLGNIPVLDQLSVAGQNLISAATSQMNSAASPMDSLDPATQDPNTVAEAQAELNAYEAKEAEPFVKPICDLFLETFELSKGNSWLRGRTVVVVLHQLLGGTIERRVRETVSSAIEDDSMGSYVRLLKGVMWPDGKLRSSTTPKTDTERARTRKEAALILDSLIPDIAGSVVGRSHAKAASRKIVAVLNNERLNTHLVFTLIDEILRLIFPESFEK